MKLLILLIAIIGVFSEVKEVSDLDKILENEAVAENYFNCLVDKGECTPDGKKLKGWLLTY